jgi:hypothetical protein
VVAQSGEDVTLVSPPEPSEYFNEVSPITSKAWNDHLRLCSAGPGIQYVGAFTDGCQPSLLGRSDKVWTPFLPFFLPLFSYISRISHLSIAGEELRELLSSAKFAAGSDDDKTLVVAAVT